ncbi:MAG TPA: DUF115 domain-containing protein [Treponemataceae bacterium]|nr:DUF115 domain-containing protein [Treponemataceae bacterium]
MNSIFNKNVEKFKLRLPHLYKAHEKSIHFYANRETPVEYEQCTILPSRSGKPTVKEKGILLHSLYNPEAEALKSVQTKDLQDKDAVVFLGYGLGYGPIAYSSAFPNKSIILIEPDINRVLWAFQYIDFSPLFNHSSLICLFTAGLHECIGVLEQIGLHNCSFIQQQYFTMHAQHYFSGLLELIERNKQKKEINDNTLERFGKLWLKNSIKNTQYLHKLQSIQCLQNFYSGERAFILAAGPTLSEVLPFIKQIQEKAVLICVDTALRSCLSAGVEPDFIILVDPQYWNARHIEGLRAKNSILITEIAAYPSVFHFECRQILLCSSLYPFGQYIEKHCGEYGKLSAGGSVATTAWDFAQWIGCTTIFFAGLDLSYPDKKTHVKGSTFEEKAIRNSKRISTAETNSIQSLFSAPAKFELNYEKKAVLTDSRMKLYAWWFESKCASMPQITTYSVTKKSMKIPGISYYPLEEFLSVSPKCSKQLPVFTHQENHITSGLLQNLLQSVHAAAVQVHEGIQICSQASKILFETDKQRKLLEKLQIIDQNIRSSEIKETISLIFPGKKKLDTLFEKAGLGKDSEPTFLSSIQQSKIIYSELLHGLKILQDLLQKIQIVG